ncbi:ethanolamine ammonia-lyase reactivating factor EutA [Thauera linaloolentis]|uniref:Reactivating factor for ethanolamine ammonia lyase n=1 Tax=Thauera linaloolentis (strain DSM 12138 / JCM 21573 / CCUG 41526 / CIP 105981 / IAM 15112 / NBRC 102519 / 47Lol) TaxID=1123367 RepID=N6Z6W8_THAL4|nr:ethanolamine ammonia-lyase reactivating factor EutA [Thauera linaloolentis]ENO90118.1 reactivating factor for ethanolamine ammonia lyase [Thauera linaloolentis 47Lol = DSM 12138]MCM8564744.1 ethanolamine ammonia-lyase reactivating factor EutA [Thauera linaloolentis]
MAESWQIYSVGIDIGTTTSQVIFSRLEVVNRAAASQVPNYEFSRREILYVSPAIATPVDFEGHLHDDKLRQFIMSQYAAAGLDTEQVKSGAIIITGETSKARNARQAVMGLAEQLGDFIVATAGPHLESVIAGQGSGAAEYARTNTCRVLNIDIGGGTSNYAVFEAGRVVDTACLNVGGHLLELESDGRLRHLHAPTRPICAELFGADQARRLGSGQRVDDDTVAQLAERMAGLIHEICVGQPSPLARQLLMTESLRPGHRYDAVYLSGGVGACYYDPHSAASARAFGDIGPALAEALHRHPGMQALPLREPRHTLRATVIGAGAYSLSLSGSTIWVDEQHLPVRNLPVVHATRPWAGCSAEQLAADWGTAMQRMDLVAGKDGYALGLPDDLPVAYADVERAIDAIVHFAAAHPDPARALFIVARQDLGKVLGMLLQPRLQGRKLAVIDEVQTRPGDYIDVGKPFMGGEIVPITVKSLAFPG